MAHVEPGDIHSAGNHFLQHFGGFGLWAEGADNFGSSHAATF
jgi:hypothetical protein